MRTVYFDYNATTPLDPKVREAMLPFLGEIWGNPSSIHHIGRRARSILDEARDRAALLLRGKPSEIIFTSGGTESANLAIFGTARLLKARGHHIITSSIEHQAVLHACEHLARNEGFQLTCLPVDSGGRVDPSALEKALRSDTILVSIMAANNEIGTIQPVAELASICHARGVPFHTDAAQYVGKAPLDSLAEWNADLISICAHKLHGPRGAGILYARSPLRPEPIIWGGSHENERRAGTENLPAIVGMVEALERFAPSPVFAEKQLSPLTTRLLEWIDRTETTTFVGSRSHRLANTVSFLVERTDSIAMLAGLDLEGICASSGSACSAGSVEPSHVIRALGFNPPLAHSLVRFSLGRETTAEEVTYVETVLPSVIRRAQHSK
jgi:cysteine desulfurase